MLINFSDVDCFSTSLKPQQPSLCLIIMLMLFLFINSNNLLNQGSMITNEELLVSTPSIVFFYFDHFLGFALKKKCQWNLVDWLASWFGFRAYVIFIIHQGPLYMLGYLMLSGLILTRWYWIIVNIYLLV